MYFEVAGRQTGKTVRLVRAIICGFIENNDEKIILFSPTYRMSHNINNLILKTIENLNIELKEKFNRNFLIISSKEQLKAYDLIIGMMMNECNVKIYIDEVFNCTYLIKKLYTLLKDENISKMIYCSGTPTHNGTEIYNKLKELNKGNVINITRYIG